MDQEPFIMQDSSWMTLLKWKKQDYTVTAGVTTRKGGLSSDPYDSFNLAFHVDDKRDRVFCNRNRLAKKLGVSMNHWVCAEQIHGAGIYKVGKSDSGKGGKDLESALPGTDGLYTKDTGLLLALAYADCVPLYFFAPRHGLIGIAHAGWRGTAANIVGKMVDTWAMNEDVPLDEIYTAIGPSISECCYEVDSRVIQQVDAVLEPQGKRPYRQTGEQHYHLNMKEWNRKLLIKAGISEDHIETSCYCTSCRTDLFYSHRKEKEQTGRMLGFIMKDNL